MFIIAIVTVFFSAITAISGGRLIVDTDLGLLKKIFISIVFNVINIGQVIGHYNELGVREWDGWAMLSVFYIHKPSDSGHCSLV